MKRGIFFKMLAAIITMLTVSIAASAQGQKVTTTAVCRFLSDPDNTRSVIAYIPDSTELTVIGVKDNYLLVEYEGKEGYINSEKVKSESVNSVIQGFVSGKEEQAVPAVDYKSNEYQQARYDILVEKYGEPMATALFNHKIWKGINHNMVRDSWGKPVEIKRTINDFDITEEWIYPKTRLIFVNDVLTRWGPNK
jgi:hypothetical protein